jgi:hypothetical protein
VAYVDTLQPRCVRRRALRDTKHFACECVRCEGMVQVRAHMFLCLCLAMAVLSGHTRSARWARQCDGRPPPTEGASPETCLGACTCTACGGVVPSVRDYEPGATTACSKCGKKFTMDAIDRSLTSLRVRGACAAPRILCCAAASCVALAL